MWIGLKNSLVFQNNVLPKPLNQNVDECIIQSLIYERENGSASIHVTNLMAGALIIFTYTPKGKTDHCLPYKRTHRSAIHGHQSPESLETDIERLLAIIIIEDDEYLFSIRSDKSHIVQAPADVAGHPHRTR